MDKQKLEKSRKHEKRKRSWFEFINDNSNKATVPLGSPFQADIPEWTSPSLNKCSIGESSDARWLGTDVWPSRRRGQDPKSGEIGKGRVDSCQCAAPGSVECVKCHVAEKRVQLRRHLGTAFQKWKFDEMGEDVSKSWSAEEQKRFNSIMRMYPSSDKKTSMQLTLESFPSKSRLDIISYYFNVHVPRWMSAQTRAGYDVADSTDDDVPIEAPRLKTPQKRNKPDGDTVSKSNEIWSKYLKGRR